jgi:hypothetical protein
MVRHDSPAAGTASFSWDFERDAWQAFLASHCGEPVEIVQDAEGGFPDDTQASGPTVISVETLAEVARWFGISLEEARLRFRANIEIEGEEPWSEDRLFAGKGEAAPFQIGEVMFRGVNPCARCSVPGRDTRTGLPTPGFEASFRVKRLEHLPEWANRSQFDHFFRAAVNTRCDQPGAIVRVGDSVTPLN